MTVHKAENAASRLSRQCEDVLRLTQSVEPDLREIAKTARANQELTQRFLRAANSVGLGLQHPVSDVQHALALLGARKIAQIVEDVRHTLPPPPVMPPPPVAGEPPSDEAVTKH